MRDSVCEDVIIKDYDATLIDESNKVDLHGMRRTMGGGVSGGEKQPLNLKPFGHLVHFWNAQISKSGGTLK